MGWVKLHPNFLPPLGSHKEVLIIDLYRPDMVTPLISLGGLAQLVAYQTSCLLEVTGMVRAYKS